MSSSFLARSLRAPLLALAALPLLACAAAAQAAEPAFDPAPAPASGPFFGFVLEGGIEGGGDEMATTLFEDGTTQEMHAGQGGTVAVGGQVRMNRESPLALRGTVGLKYVTTAATNAHIRFTRIPIELVATYDLPSNVWIGGGVVRHTAMKFRGDGLGPDMDFDDATGGTVELGWRWAALTLTSLQYRDAEGGEYDASSAGLSIIYVFGR
jgi:hypothetical protein